MAESVSNISGLVSGIDWETTIQQLMAIEARPMQLLEQHKQEQETRLSIWQQINTKLQSLESTAKNFVHKEDFLSKLATSTDSDTVSASATGEAQPGTHVISSITSLARANNYVSASSYSSLDSTFGQGAGSFVINLADHPDGAQQITLTYGTDYSASTTLAEFCDLINNHPDNDNLVNASIVNDGSGANPYKLVITAANSGTDYRITSISDTSTGLVMAQGLTAQNCVFTIDSVNVTKNSNQVDDVIEGVTLTFLNSGITSDVIVNVENDIATVKTNINSIVNAYNDLKTLMNTTSSYDEENEIMAPLLGDGYLSSVRAKMDAIISGIIPGLSSSAPYTNLSQIGIKTDGATGLLTIDDSDLTDALEDNFAAIGNVFCEKAATDNNSISYISRTTKTNAGNFTVVVNYDASGNITSATINGHNANIIGSLVQGASGYDEEGLLLKFTYPGSGSQETAAINLSLGVNAQFEKQLDFITGTEFQEGEVYWVEDQLNTTIDNLDEQISDMEARLVQKEQILRKQFTQLETMMSQFRSQSSYLQSVLG
jgi:flagellar hook-associated protein 2